MIRINLKPVSVNECFTGQRWKTAKYAQYVKDIGFLAPKLTLPLPPYQITLKFAYSNPRSDFDNAIKTTVDSLAAKYKFDDKLIRRAVIETEIVEKGKEYFEFCIEHLENK